jgi:hypothetical protein
MPYSIQLFMLQSMWQGMLPASLWCLCQNSQKGAVRPTVTYDKWQTLDRIFCIWKINSIIFLSQARNRPQHNRAQLFKITEKKVFYWNIWTFCTFFNWTRRTRPSIEQVFHDQAQTDQTHQCRTIGFFVIVWQNLLT